MLRGIWIVSLFAFSSYLLSVSIKPTEGERDRRVLVTGLLGLACAALLLHPTYSVVFARLPHAAIVFRMVRALLTGMFAAMLVSMGFKKGARIMLIAAGVLFVATPLALAFFLHKAAPEAALRPILISPRMFSLEAWPVGLAIPAAILLFSHGGRGAGQASESAPAEQADESGTKA